MEQILQILFNEFLLEGNILETWHNAAVILLKGTFIHNILMLYKIL